MTVFESKDVFGVSGNSSFRFFLWTFRKDFQELEKFQSSIYQKKLLEQIKKSS